MTRLHAAGLRRGAVIATVVAGVVAAGGVLAGPAHAQFRIGGVGGNFDSATAFEREGTVSSGPGGGTVDWYGGAGPGVARVGLTGDFHNVPGSTLRHEPQIVASAQSELTISGPPAPTSVPASLNLHVDGVLRRTCTGSFTLCEANARVFVRFFGHFLSTEVNTEDGIRLDTLGLQLTPTAEGLRIHGDVTTPVQQVPVNQPLLVVLEVSVAEDNLANPVEATVTHDHDFRSMLEGRGVTFAPDRPVLNVPDGYEVNGSGVVDNRWSDPFAPDTVHEGDLVVTDCDDPFLATVTEVTGSLIIEDLDCDTGIALPNLVRVGGDVTVRDVVITVESTGTETIDLSQATVFGDVTVTDVVITVESTGTETIDLSLGTVIGDVIVIENDGTEVIDLDLDSAAGDVTVTENPDTQVIDFGDLDSAGGNVTVTDNGEATVDVGDLDEVGGNLTIETTFEGSFSTSTAEGATDITILGGTAEMHMVLPEGTFSQPVKFTIERQGDEPAQEGTTADGDPAEIDPIAGYRFSFEVPELNRDATLDFTIDLSQLDDATRQAVLEGAQDGSATLAVKGDEDGDTYQGLRRCADGETPAEHDCVRVVMLDAEGNPVSDPAHAAFVRFEGVTGHFSTWAVALVEPHCTGPLAELADALDPLIRPHSPQSADAARAALCGQTQGSNRD